MNDIEKMSFEFFSQLSKEQLEDIIVTLKEDAKTDVGGKLEAEKDMIELLESVLNSK